MTESTPLPKTASLGGLGNLLKAHRSSRFSELDIKPCVSPRTTTKTLPMTKKSPTKLSLWTAQMAGSCIQPILSLPPLLEEWHSLKSLSLLFMILPLPLPPLSLPSPLKPPRTPPSFPFPTPSSPLPLPPPPLPESFLSHEYGLTPSSFSNRNKQVEISVTLLSCIPLPSIVPTPPWKWCGLSKRLIPSLSLLLPLVLWVGMKQGQRRRKERDCMRCIF